VSALSFCRIPGVPEVGPGADLSAIIIDALRGAGELPDDGDLVAVAQKIV